MATELAQNNTIFRQRIRALEYVLRPRTVDTVPVRPEVGACDVYTLGMKLIFRYNDTGPVYKYYYRNLDEAAPTFSGTATLASGTVAVTCTGMTTSYICLVTLKTAVPVLGIQYKAVPTANTLTISAVDATNGVVATDGSTLFYHAFLTPPGLLYSATDP